MGPRELEVLLYEFKDGLNQYLKAAGSPHASLEAIIAFNKAHADTVMPFFGQELFERAQAKGPLTDPAYLKARDNARRLAGRDGLLAALDRDRLDAIIAPSMSPAWPTDHLLGDHSWGQATAWPPSPEPPASPCPWATSQGLPLGLTIMGRAYDENGIIALASSIEQTMKARAAAVRPQFHSHASTEPESMMHEPTFAVARSRARHHRERYHHGPTEPRPFTS